MDQINQALSIGRQVIPATQWAINYLNSGLNKVNTGLNNAGKDFFKGLTGAPGEGALSSSLPQSFGDFVGNGMTGGEGQTLGEGVSALGQGAHALTNGIDLSHILPLALGMISEGDHTPEEIQAARQFGQALRGSGDVPAGLLNNMLDTTPRLVPSPKNPSNLVSTAESLLPYLTEGLNLVPAKGNPRKLIRK